MATLTTTTTPKPIDLELVDITAPTLTITSPTGPIEVGDAGVTITGTAVDVKGATVRSYASGVATVECTVGGTTITATALTAQFATWQAWVPLPLYVPAGGTTYTITV